VRDVGEVIREAVTAQERAAELVPPGGLDDGERDPGEDDRRAENGDQEAATTGLRQRATSGRER
jgi:hypothetical protein